VRIGMIGGMLAILVRPRAAKGQTLIQTIVNGGNMLNGMVRSATVFVALCSAAGIAAAALPPQAEREVEMQAILHSSDVRRALDTRQPIDAIEAVGDDLYRVRAGRCRVTVRVADDKRAPDIPGPRRFVLKIVRRSCE
jgi:hypothetical protein